MMLELSALRLRRELLPGPAGHRPDRREAAGLDLPRPVDDAAHLSGLDPARHPQGGARRQPLRRLDQRADLVGYAIPSFLFAVLLIVLFAGGSYFSGSRCAGWCRRIWAQLSWSHRILDYFWHMVAAAHGAGRGRFATLTMLTKNSFLEEIGKQYVLTARAKGLDERRVLYGHVFRNAMLIVIAGFPAAFIGVLFTGSLLIEIIFSLDGLGLLGYEAVINRDYPMVFGTLYIFTLVGLLLKMISDLDLHPGRSADRLRGAGRSGGEPQPTADGLRLGRPLAPLGARRLANFKANGAATSRCAMFLVLFVLSPDRRADRQRPAAAGPLRGQRSTSRCSCDLPRDDVRRLLRHRGRLPRSRGRRADPGQGLDRLAADPLSATTRSTTTCRPAPSPPSCSNWLGTDDQARDLAGAADLRLSHLGPVRPGADHR